jgi:hypothetical protein
MGFRANGDCFSYLPEYILWISTTREYDIRICGYSEFSCDLQDPNICRTTIEGDFVSD